MTIYKPYTRWNTRTAERLAAPPSPMSRQHPPHLHRLPEPTEQLGNEEMPAMHILRVFPCTARPWCVYMGMTASTAAQHPSLAPCTIGTSQNDAKWRNESDMPEMRPFRAFHLSSPTWHVDPPAMVPTTPSYTSLAPCTIRASQNNTKQQGSGRSQLYKELQEDIKSLQDLVERAVKEFEEHRADIASRSVTISSSPQLPTAPVVMEPRSVEIRPTPKLPTPPVVRLPPSLTWVSSPTSTAPTPLVLPPTLASPVAPPNFNKPLPPLPPTADSPPPTFPTAKPDLGLVVHTIVHVSPEKAPPPHPFSPSITGVVLFSLLLLYYQGSYHWLESQQPGFSKRLGICPDPEPPPEVPQLHSPAIGTGHVSFRILP
jgi:hypothetical protein